MNVAVLVVDDQLPFRLAARAVIGRADGFELVGEAASGEEAVTMVADLHPQLVLMDINMPGINGIEATRRVLEAAPSTVVFLCSTYQLADLPADAASSGARAYVNKEELGPDVLAHLWSERANAAGFTACS
jgi:DNA-binding NarL/FixJ family response regulator